MVRKLIILGIDGMDWDVVQRYKDDMPNLYGLMEENGFPRMPVCFSCGYDACLVYDLYGS